MTPRERALCVFRYQQPDIPCFDLMEGTTWPRLGWFFRQKYGLNTNQAVLDFLGCDFQWSHLFGQELPLPGSEAGVDKLLGTNYSDTVGEFPLADVETVHDVDRIFHPDPAARPIPDFRAMRAAYPDRAIVFCISWTPIFSGACSQFGMAEAMVRLALEPEIFKAYAIKQGEYLYEYCRLALEAGAAEYCDFAWMGDDFASESNLLLSPADWRQYIRPYLEKPIRLFKEKGLHTLFHSCGAVSEVYPDFIDMGIDAHIGVQTSARGMDAARLAKDFGGKIAVFGGVDAQTILVSGTPDDVRREVRRNLDAIANCGGYVVSNSHHALPDISGENILAMAEAAGRAVPV